MSHGVSGVYVWNEIIRKLKDTLKTPNYKNEEKSNLQNQWERKPGVKMKYQSQMKNWIKTDNQ